MENEFNLQSDSLEKRMSHIVTLQKEHTYKLPFRQGQRDDC